MKRKRKAIRIFASVLIAHLLVSPSMLRAQDKATVDAESLEQLVEDLEKAKAAYEKATQDVERLKQRVSEELDRAREAREAATADRGDREELEQRVEELEASRGAAEDATRSIIRETFFEWGPRINEFVILGGTLEVAAGWEEQFDTGSDEFVRLDTAELDMEIQVNDWVNGRFTIEYIGDEDVVVGEGSTDRINLDVGYVDLGDTERFPFFGRFGRAIVPFGISTGDPVADVLTLQDPLTIEAFETRQDIVMLGVAVPTPPLAPATQIPAPPPVRPMILQPLMSAFGRYLGYRPIPRPVPQPMMITPPPPPPPVNLGIYTYNVDRPAATGDSDKEHVGATVGFQTKQQCDSPILCPWSVDVDIDYNNSVFDSRFLEFEYRDFQGQIGFVSGLAAHVKASAGPIAFVGEWNGAVDDAKFVDDRGVFIDIKPSAWQISLGYQLDWNPYVEELGAQGTYLALGYSQTNDLAGAGMLNGTELEFVGGLPEQRFIASVGEWVLPGVRVAVEYSHDEDYEAGEGGGTGNSADAVRSVLTLDW